MTNFLYLRPRHHHIYFNNFYCIAVTRLNVSRFQIFQHFFLFNIQVLSTPSDVGTQKSFNPSILLKFFLGFSGSSMKSFTQPMPLENYKDCLNFIICPEPQVDCYFGNCDQCPGTQRLYELVTRVYGEKEVETITFKQWITTPQCTLQKMVQPLDVFVKYFCDQVQLLLKHAFINDMQNGFLKRLKESLKCNEFICILDFAENYAFVVQQAAAGFHWNNNQATIFPVVIYWKSDDGILQHKSLVITSDNLAHDATTVHIFIQIVINWLKKKFTKIEKIYYFSDGAPSQFKNYKNVLNLFHHIEDFGIPAEWHFFPTAHGKGPCDGVGGTVKRTAAAASLQLPVDEQILTPEELHNWFEKCGRFQNIEFFFSSKAEAAATLERLGERLSSKRRVKGLREQHALVAEVAGIRSKLFSLSDDSTFVSFV